VVNSNHTLDLRSHTEETPFQCQVGSIHLHYTKKTKLKDLLAYPTEPRLYHYCELLQMEELIELNIAQHGLHLEGEDIEV